MSKQLRNNLSYKSNGVILSKNYADYINKDTVIGNVTLRIFQQTIGTLSNLRTKWE